MSEVQWFDQPRTTPDAAERAAREWFPKRGDERSVLGIADETVISQLSDIIRRHVGEEMRKKAAEIERLKQDVQTMTECAATCGHEIERLRAAVRAGDVLINRMREGGLLRRGGPDGYDHPDAYDAARKKVTVPDVKPTEGNAT